MEIMLVVLTVVSVALVAALAVYGCLARRRLQEREREVSGLQVRLEEQGKEIRRLENQHAGDEQRIANFQNMEEQFALLANRVLQESQRGFLNLANDKFLEHMRPVSELLGQYRDELGEIEKNRKKSEGSLKTELQGLMVGQQSMRDEAARLREALRGSAHARGRWGERSLKNAAELAGMSEHCDFFSQQEITSEESRFRPDMVIRMSDGGSLAVDSKAPLENYLESLDATDEKQREGHLLQFSKNLRSHMLNLGSKQYWRGLKLSPEFVVMYVPGDHFLAAALKESPNLWEEAIERKVLIATPTIFLAVVRTIAYGWKARAADENVARIATLGRELYERIATMGEHVDKMGRGLDSAVKNYNHFIGSLEGRVLPKAREFSKLGVFTGREELSRLHHVETARTAPAAPELER